MKIGGFQKLTLLDFPEQVACIVFTAGCNFRCPYCHNSSLVENLSALEPVGEEEVFSYLKKRQGLLDGVVISGGEPLLQPDVEDFIRRVRDLQYLVKIDTNGACPEKLGRLLSGGLVDYVAMDIKHAPGRYGEAIGVDGGKVLPQVEESIARLRGSGIPYEFRTTLVKGIHDEAGVEEMARWIAGPEPYYLQTYEDPGTVLRPEGLEPFTYEEMHRMAEIARRYCPQAAVRGE